MPWSRRGSLPERLTQRWAARAQRTSGKAGVIHVPALARRGPSAGGTPAARDAMTAVSLDDKYTLERGQIFLSGVQAIVRLALDQHRRDARAGLATGGYVSGYRGSPLGGVDFAFWQAAALAESNDIKFSPGLNEELAATAVGGTQQIAAIGRSKFDGVFGIWYGKNPGLDRAGDAIEHGTPSAPRRIAGFSRSPATIRGSSSSLPNAMRSGLHPPAFPCSVRRMSAIYCASASSASPCRAMPVLDRLETVSDTVECAADSRGDPSSRQFCCERFRAAAAGLGAGWPDDRWSQDMRQLNFACRRRRRCPRQPSTDRFGDRAARRLVIVTSGKAYGDVRHALAQLGIDQAVAAASASSSIKSASCRRSSRNACATRSTAPRRSDDRERRAVLEPQIGPGLTGRPTGGRASSARATKTAPPVPESGELSPRIVALALGKRPLAWRRRKP